MGRFASIAAALAATGAVVTTVADARAASPVKLAYDRGRGAEGCPSEERLRGAVAHRLGRDPFSSDGDDTLSVEIAAGDGVLRGRFSLQRAGRELGAQTVETRGAPDERLAGHVASNCEELVDAIALEVALALDAAEPTAGAAPPPAPEAPASAPPARALAPPAPATSARAASPSAATPWSLRAAGGGRVSVGSWAEVAFSPEIGLEARRGFLGVGLDARVDIIPQLDVQSARASVVRPAGSLLGCAHGGWFFGCAVATLGVTTVHGLDLASSQTATDAYAAFGGRGGLDLPLGSRLHLVPFVELVGVATPTTVRIEAASAGGAALSVSSRGWDGAAGISLAGSIL